MNKDLKIKEAALFLGISPDTLRRWEKSGKIQPINIGKGNHRRYNFSQLEFFLLNNLDFFANRWVSDNSDILPNNLFYCPDSYIFQSRLYRLKEDLNKIEIDDNLVSLILAVVGEIGNNSFDHNIGKWPGAVGIFFAFNVEKREIFLIDKGQGILKTLQKIVPNLSDDFLALEKAFTEIISGRSPESRGNGLKFVKSAVTNSKIKLYFQSGEACLNLNEKQGKIKIKKALKEIPGCFAKLNF